MILAPGILEGFGLTLVRTSALVLGAPLLGTGSTFAGYKIGLCGVLALVLFVALGMPPVAVSSAVEFGVLALREVLVGLTLAFVLHLVLLGVRVASELIGHEMAFNMSGEVDPASGGRVPTIAFINELLFLMALLAVNGHHWLVRALFESTARAPVGQLAFGQALPALVLQQFTQLFAAGLTFAAPILVTLMLVSLVIALLTRAVPQVNVLEFGFTLRILGGLGALYLFAPAFVPAMERLLVRLMDGLAACLNALEL